MDQGNGDVQATALADGESAHGPLGQAFRFERGEQAPGPRAGVHAGASLDDQLVRDLEVGAALLPWPRWPMRRRTPAGSVWTSLSGSLTVSVPEQVRPGGDVSLVRVIHRLNRSLAFREIVCV